MVITPVEDLAELTDIPFSIFADPELSVFRKMKAFKTEPLHATFVFSACGDVLLKDVGEEPFTDFNAIEKALKGESAFEKRK